ncbi:unnamed protein product [Thelazia callipaeda]|uniref:Tudor domain-containing protein n=1 Tax=Thelazia callipaeda TaxID=103827 RepID=A0A0N5CNF3_THECL|nr:unnamed protein product [Thelazia callipaeda]
MDGRYSPRLYEVKNRKGRRDIPKMLPNGNILGDGNYKIHRIYLTRTATCIVSHVLSPSCIWVKPLNHITNQLQIRDLNTLTPATLLTKDRYVMAPVEEGVYGRARIREFDKECKMARVLFIDEGTSVWMSIACLAKMGEWFAYHPWQAIPVALFKVRPLEPLVPTGFKEKWSIADTMALRSILKRFQFVRVEAILSTIFSNDYRDFVKVNMFGLESERDKLGASITEMFVRARFGHVHFDRLLFDAITQNIYKCIIDKESPPEKGILPAWQLRFPEKIVVFGDLQLMKWEEVRENDMKVQEINLAWLIEHNYSYKGEFVMSIEGGETISPYEFYGHPLKFTRNEKKSEKYVGQSTDNSIAEAETAMIDLNEELMIFESKLSIFYSHEKNRKRLTPARVFECLKNCVHVYGIAEGQNINIPFNECWQRVEVLGIKEAYYSGSYYTRVRFLDRGGTAVRLLCNVIQIHPMHCVLPPLSVQMCLFGLKPAKNPDWSEEAKKFFIDELREDVPISLQIVGCSKK